MNNYKLIVSTVIILLCTIPGLSFATDIKDGEKAAFDEFWSLIPKDKFKHADDLFTKWQKVQSEKSKAIILDIRTRGEFDAGHIIGSNNMDPGHAYILS